MATPFIDFRPAEVRKNKETYILYYVLDPTTDRLKRMRVRCNRVKSPGERKRYTALLCAEINRKLYNGWNPLIGEEAATKRVSIVQDHHCHFFCIFAPSKPPPMSRRRTYPFVHPLRGCGNTRGNALGYRYASPDGDGFPVTYSVTHSHTDHSSLITVHSSHTFSARERDAETGLSYFGARYYSSDLSIWLSVDPMSGKYPSLSPYVYCADNPVKLVDPNGEEVWLIGEDGSRIKYTQGMIYDGQDKCIMGKVNTLNQINSTRSGKKLLGELTSSNNVYSITDNSDDNYSTPYFCANDDVNGKSGGVIVTQGQNTIGTISHELFHAYQDEKGQGQRSIHNEAEAMLLETSVVTEHGWNINAAYPRSPLLGDNDDYNTSVDALLDVFSSTNMNIVTKEFKDHSGANRGGAYDNNYPLRRSNHSKNLIENFYPLMPWKK